MPHLNVSSTQHSSTSLDSPSGLICLPAPYGVIPAWLAPLLVPYCSPIMDWPAFSVSSLKFLLFSLATLTPRAGPSQDFFWALRIRTLVSWGERFETSLPCRQERTDWPQPCRGSCFRKDHWLETDPVPSAHRQCRPSGTFRCFLSKVQIYVLCFHRLSNTVQKYCQIQCNRTIYHLLERGF